MASLKLSEGYAVAVIMASRSLEQNLNFCLFQEMVEPTATGPNMQDSFGVEWATEDLNSKEEASDVYVFNGQTHMS